MPRDNSLALLAFVAVFISLRAAVAAASDNDNAALLQLSSQAKVDAGLLVPGAYFRQELTNDGDSQYTSTLSIGGQELTGILDTGSFDLVVFPTTCATCGAAGKYNTKHSDTYTKGILTSSQSYGSGDAYSQEAFDYVKLGTYQPVNQSFWTVNRATMPILFQAEFQAIIGVGPPETPASDAWKYVLEDFTRVLDKLENGEHAPKKLLKNAGDSVKIATEISAGQSLLRALSVNMFSVCIGGTSGSAGAFIWNDDSPYKMPSVFTKVPVVGAHSWAIKLNNAGIKMPGSSETVQLGCSEEDGCSALLDTGTSLISVPTILYKKLTEATEGLKSDCSNMKDMPDIVFELGDMQVRLPPAAYIAQITGDVPTQYQSFLAVRNVDPYSERKPSCQLFLMEVASDSMYGSAFILGIPFFRHYYTTFKIGSSKASRAVYLAPAGRDCTPASKEMQLSTVEPSVRRINASRLYMPKRVQQAATEHYVRL